MDFPELIKQYKPFIQQHLLSLFLGLSGIVLVGYGGISLLSSSESSSAITFGVGNNEQTATASAQDKRQLVIDIEGAVVRPGVYKLPLDTRLQDAFVAAGGLAEQADRVWVSKDVNLASLLHDGMKIYIRFQGEAASSNSSGSVVNADQSVVSDNSQASANGSININTASQAELDSLPGIGVVTAQKIISGRPYTAIEDLVNKKIVNSKVWSQIKDKISVD